MKTFPAIIIHPELISGRCSGELQITFSQVVFTADEISFSINFSTLTITAGGAGNRFIFFKDKNQPEISIYTSDKSVLKDANIVNNPNLLGEIKNSKKVLNKTLRTSLIVLGSIVLLVLGFIFLKVKMVSKIANQVPKSWEKTAGDKLFSAMSMQFAFVTNDSLKKEFLKVAAPLFKQIEQEGYDIDLYFVNDPTINAFALPGGKVIIQTGLIANAKSWEEVMGVLGHELAHVTKRHHIRGVIDNIGVFTLMAVVLGDVSAIAGTFANVGGELASLSNSREFENEADEAGLKYLENAHINPNGMISFFETLKKEHATEMDSTINKTVDLSFLSTHPNTQDRIDNLKEKVSKLNQKFIALPNNFSSFKDALLNAKK